MPWGAGAGPGGCVVPQFPQGGSAFGRVGRVWALCWLSPPAPGSPSGAVFVMRGHTVTVWVTLLVHPGTHRDGAAPIPGVWGPQHSKWHQNPALHMSSSFSAAPMLGGEVETGAPPRPLLGALQVFYRWRKPQISRGEIALREGLLPALSRAVHGLRVTNPATVLGHGEGTLQPLSPPSSLHQ